MLLRPVNGVTVSVAGRDPRDYYEHSVTIGLAPLRRSRIPLALDVSSVT